MQSHLTLHKTYYNQGFWNVPVGLDRYVRPDEGPITLVLGKSGREVEAFVNRSANQNGTARIMGRSSLRNWFQQNYAVMDDIPVRFVTPKRIILGTRNKDASLDTQRLRVRITEHGVTIPKSLLPDVEEVDIRRRNGVIEVAPVDENDRFPMRELGVKFDRSRKGPIPEDDPIMQLGRNPVSGGVPDGARNHDKYIYGA